ncbi:MAG: helix-turn-helix domain-containing protein [Gammaproteobacteria bacterium]
MTISTFADALRKVWKDSGLRQEEFAERLEYRRPTVANMMRGTHLPPLGFLDKVDEFFPGTRSELEPLLHRERQEREQAMNFLRRRSQGGIDLSGTWHAVWETTAGDELTINTEVLRVTQFSTRVTIENEQVSPENPIGGYLWRADCTVHDNTFLMGTYAALDPNYRQRGVLFYTVHRSGQFMAGRWVGCNYDVDLYDGLAVLAREPEVARVRFDKAFEGTRDDRRS